ncbi:MAG: Wzz/FepE/Etk N-terminal domain-containing protein, partial [bacterium]|nr:Wzz/FepE/Etk N-terminal domain-containing protein [bacterium]MDW8163765.1 Wzz/FepE/Etk N-terminal domain-containing protein [Candidatus Omnitrophota bacterium]
MKTQKLKNGILKGSPIKRHIILIVLIYLALINLAILLYLISPKYYKATSSILQPPESEISEISTQSGKFTKEPLSLIRTNTELFFSILNSRRMKDDIIEKFDLKKHYNVDNDDEAKEILEERTNIFLTKDKVIQIDVIDRNPNMAADIANFYTSNLDFLIKELTITTAKQNRIFIEKRLKETTELIEQLERRLTEIQNMNKLVVDPELSQISHVGGKLMEQLINKQLELEK